MAADHDSSRADGGGKVISIGPVGAAGLCPQEVVASPAAGRGSASGSEPSAIAAVLPLPECRRPPAKRATAAQEGRQVGGVRAWVWAHWAAFNRWWLQPGSGQYGPGIFDFTPSWDQSKAGERHPTQPFRERPR